MELDRIGVVLRPRSPREALDLGAGIVRAHAGAVWPAWFAFTLPFVLGANLLGVLVGLPWLGLLLVAWLKPLFDRVPLYVISRAVFGEVPGWRAALGGQRAWPWAPTWHALSWRRIDSWRALRLPMELLEGTGAEQRAQRWKVLRRRVSGEAGLLIGGCTAFELVLGLGVVMLLWSLVPKEWAGPLLPGVFKLGGSSFVTPWWLAAAAVQYLAISAIEPLYVACGFALYLHRRTELEAWDLELTFRRLRKRLAGLGLALLLGLGAVLVPAPALHAETPAAEESPTVVPSQALGQPVGALDARFAEAAKQALADPRFGTEVRRKGWHLKPIKHTQPPTPGPQPLGVLLALVAKGLLWLLVLAALVVLAWFAWRWRANLLPRSEDVDAEPLPASTAARRQPGLPADPECAARELWQAGERRAALALVYRVALEQLAQRLQQPPAMAATEADCLRHARRLDDGDARRRIEQIVRTWQLAAYAGRFPDPAGFDALFAGWPFQTGARA